MEFRSPLKRAKGLGSAKEGAAHWWAQRLTAVALVPLLLWFVFELALRAGGDYEQVRAWLGSPLPAILAVLLVGTLLHHAQLGLQVVLEDYVHVEWVKVASIVLVKFAAFLTAAVGIFSVLRIAFGG